MRTKTLLLAASVIAAGIVSSEAQSNVYSQNIVGYSTYISQTTTPSFELICNPLDNGTNTLASVLPTPPGGTSVQIWQPSTGSFLLDTYTTAKGWHTNATAQSGASVLVAPGTGFFVSWGSGPYTNTWIGNVDPAVGVMETNVLAAGFTCDSSTVPYADIATNGATIDLPLPGGNQVQLWNVGNQSFDLYVFSGGKIKLNGVQTNILLNVGQGFFYNNNSTPLNWVQTGP
jgi:hypothetical protein